MYLEGEELVWDEAAGGRWLTFGVGLGERTNYFPIKF